MPLEPGRKPRFNWAAYLLAYLATGLVATVVIGSTDWSPVIDLAATIAVALVVGAAVHSWLRLTQHRAT